MLDIALAVASLPFFAPRPISPDDHLQTLHEVIVMEGVS